MQRGDSAESFMRRAIRLARKGRGRTSPNPMVGAVIVRDGVIAAQGWHRKAGEPHGEINAIRAAGDRARGSDLYINLEPCSHFGRTPPCADAVIKAGIKRAFIAMEDPNPKVAGEGIKQLREAGVEVYTGLLEKEARRLNEAFIKFITTGRPFVTLKAASTLDGRIATRTGESKWITGPAARRQVHRMRDGVDAILAGIGTVEKDDPSLTARLPGRKGRDPVRVILDEDLRIRPDARVINCGSGAGVIIATTTAADSEMKRLLEGLGAKVIALESSDGLVPLAPLMERLGDMGIMSVMIEGGSAVNASALREGVVDKVAIFYAPRIIGGTEAIGVIGGEGVERLSDAIALRDITTRRIGEDILVEGYINKK